GRAQPRDGTAAGGRRALRGSTRKAGGRRSQSPGRRLSGTDPAANRRVGSGTSRARLAWRQHAFRRTRRRRGSARMALARPDRLRRCGEDDVGRRRQAVLHDPPRRPPSPALRPGTIRLAVPVITAHAASTDEAHLPGIRRQPYHEPIPADPNTGPRVSASADVATSLQTTVCNIGIAAGSLADGLTL